MLLAGKRHGLESVPCVFCGVKKSSVLAGGQGKPELDCAQAHFWKALELYIEVLDLQINAEA